MPTLLTNIRLVVAAFAFVGFAVFVTPVAAQQPSTVNPTANSVKEDQLLQQLSIISGRGSIPDAKSYNLEQPAGREWREFHQRVLPTIGAIAIPVMVVLLAIFYMVRGMVRIEGGRSGRKIIRFNGFERSVHWMTAVCFIVLALTGLNVTFGKQLLLPALGPDIFAAWSQWAKYAHNFVGVPFSLGVVIIFLMWVAWTIPNGSDIKWLMAGGGIIGSEHLPTGRFNAGQKVFYWIVVLAGVAVSVTGYLMLFPFYATDIAGMQLAQIIHAVTGLLFVAVMLAHIYIGTIGMEGAYESMAVGEVDLNWAKQHHSGWVDQQLTKSQRAQARASR